MVVARISELVSGWRGAACDVCRHACVVTDATRVSTLDMQLTALCDPLSDVACWLPPAVGIL